MEVAHIVGRSWLIHLACHQLFFPSEVARVLERRWVDHLAAQSQCSPLKAPALGEHLQPSHVRHSRTAR